MEEFLYLWCKLGKSSHFPWCKQLKKCGVIHSLCQSRQLLLLISQHYIYLCSQAMLNKSKSIILHFNSPGVCEFVDPWLLIEDLRWSVCWLKPSSVDTPLSSIMWHDADESSVIIWEEELNIKDLARGFLLYKASSPCSVESKVKQCKLNNQP